MELNDLGKIQKLALKIILADNHTSYVMNLRPPFLILKICLSETTHCLLTLLLSFTRVIEVTNSILLVILETVQDMTSPLWSRIIV